MLFITFIHFYLYQIPAIVSIIIPAKGVRGETQPFFDGIVLDIVAVLLLACSQRPHGAGGRDHVRDRDR